MWVLSRYSSFLPQSKNMQLRLIKTQYEWLFLLYMSALWSTGCFSLNARWDWLKPPTQKMDGWMDSNICTSHLHTICFKNEKCGIMIMDIIFFMLFSTPPVDDLIFFWIVLCSFSPAGFKCPVCSKFVSSDEMDLHLVLCLTKPRVTYNGRTHHSYLTHTCKQMKP